MGSAIASTATMTWKRAGTTVSCGGTYTPGETLTVQDIVASMTQEREQEALKFNMVVGVMVLLNTALIGAQVDWGRAEGLLDWSFHDGSIWGG